MGILLNEEDMVVSDGYDMYGVGAEIRKRG